MYEAHREKVRAVTVRSYAVMPWIPRRELLEKVTHHRVGDERRDAFHDDGGYSCILVHICRFHGARTTGIDFIHWMCKDYCAGRSSSHGCVAKVGARTNDDQILPDPCKSMKNQ